MFLVLVKAVIIVTCGILFATAVVPPRPRVECAQSVYKGQPFEYVVRTITFMALVRLQLLAPPESCSHPHHLGDNRHRRIFLLRHLYSDSSHTISSSKVAVPLSRRAACNPFTRRNVDSVCSRRDVDIWGSTSQDMGAAYPWRSLHVRSRHCERPLARTDWAVRMGSPSGLHRDDSGHCGYALDALGSRRIHHGVRLHFISSRSPSICVVNFGSVCSPFTFLENEG